jgi:xylulokinase
MRVAARDGEAWAACDRVSLISSAMATLFVGKFAPIDHSDGSGMNLMDITRRGWCV